MKGPHHIITASRAVTAWTNAADPLVSDMAVNKSQRLRTANWVYSSSSSRIQTGGSLGSRPVPSLSVKAGLRILIRSMLGLSDIRRRVLLQRRSFSQLSGSPHGSDIRGEKYLWNVVRFFSITQCLNIPGSHHFNTLLTGTVCWIFSVIWRLLSINSHVFPAAALLRILKADTFQFLCHLHIWKSIHIEWFIGTYQLTDHG